MQCLLACSGTDRGMISDWQDRMGLGASPSQSRPRAPHGVIRLVPVSALNRATITSYRASAYQRGRQKLDRVRHFYHNGKFIYLTCVKRWLRRFPSSSI